MTVIVSLAIDAEQFDIGQVLAASTTRIELTQFVPVDGQLVPYFWKERDGDTEAFEMAVREDPRVESLVDLDGRSDARLYSIKWAEELNGFISALRNHDILVEEARTTSSAERWFFRLRAPNQRDLSAFQQACFDADVPLDIRRVQHNPDTRTGTVEYLSPEQREALVLALEEGYFKIPREHSQQELADMLGISRQSFGRRLRRAHQNHFEDLFWEDVAEE